MKNYSLSCLANDLVPVHGQLLVVYITILTYVPILEAAVISLLLYPIQW